jgi:chromosome segregation protein
MILKQLDLNGFKSFVDSTRMDFTNGFTAVVGPNGCGKSNLSDAIRWVIGEQSAKMLRGAKITDLIFNGSSDRKPVNRAEISLTLGDVPPGLRIANVPNISDEIKITRCCHRSGESEFMINQIPCRLKDISDLLLDVGVSPKVLTVIEQGHIQDIVTSKPEERRIWIEEAAGILKFKTRRNEALRKLQASGQNLDRISDIVQELERQSASLKRQSAKAEKYKELHVQIKEISLNLSSKKIRRYQKELGEISVGLTGFNDQKTQWSAKSSTLENQIVEQKTHLDSLYSLQNEKRESLHSISNTIKQKEHDIELTNSYLKQAHTDIETAVQETERMNQEIALTEKELESSRTNLGSVSDEINAIESVLVTKAGDVDLLKSSLEEQEKNAKNSEVQISESVQKSSRLKSEMSALQARDQYLNASHEKLCLEQDEISGHLETAMTALSDAEINFSGEKSSFETLQKEQEQVAQEIATARNENQNHESSLQTIKEAWLTQSSTLNSIIDLRKKFEGFGEGVKSLMDENSVVPGIRKALADVLQAPAEFEKAIESVLGERLQSLIVETHADSIAAISYLNQNQSGRGSFVPLRAKPIRRTPLYLNGNPKIVGKAVDLVKTAEEYASILERILGDTVITEDLETAIALHESENFSGNIVTLKGEVIDENGMVTGGTDNASGLLAQNRRIEDLGQEVSTLQQKLELATADSLELKENLSILEGRQTEIQTAVHESEIRLNNSEKDLESLKSEATRLRDRQTAINKQINDESSEQSSLAEQNVELQNELSEAEAKQIQAEQSLASHREEMIGQRLTIDQALESLNVEKVLSASLKGKRENILSNVQRLNQQLDNLRRSIKDREAGRQASYDKISECEGKIKTLEKEILEIAGEEDVLKEELVKVEETLNETETSLDKMEKESKELYRQVQEITEQMSRTELRQSELKIKVAHIEERAFEDYKVSLEEILNAYAGDVNEDKAGRDLTTLKEKISRLGEVNLAALSEYKVVSERYEFLARQQDDLTASVTALHETIEKINTTTHKLFMDTFDQVNEHFKTLFARLFGGGRAEMILCDPSNPLESGVDITASPVGKKMLHLSLLSGGEKTMTAIAMIFAILKVRPSPFCLLDEVDAPLDEANVLRLQEILQEMSDKTQFIMITHNQKTMSFANTLYGVTMEERGVSKIVSVNLNQSETSSRAA